MSVHPLVQDLRDYTPLRMRMVRGEGLPGGRWSKGGGPS